MIEIIVIATLIVVFVLLWDVGPFSAKLQKTKTGFRFRTQYPEDHPLADRREKIDEIVEQLGGEEDAEEQSDFRKS
jgi:hypothetical protein